MAAAPLPASAESDIILAQSLVLDRIVEDAQGALADLRAKDYEGTETLLAMVLYRIRELRAPDTLDNVVSLAARAGRAVDAR